MGAEVSQDHLYDIAGQGRPSGCELRADGNAPGGSVTALCGSQRVEIPGDQRRRGSGRVLTTAQLPRSAGHGYSVVLHTAPPGKTAIPLQDYPESSPGPMRASAVEGQN